LCNVLAAIATPQATVAGFARSLLALLELSRSQDLCMHNPRSINMITSLFDVPLFAAAVFAIYM
jgi:hypothetical protein